MDNTLILLTNTETDIANFNTFIAKNKISTNFVSGNTTLDNSTSSLFEINNNKLYILMKGLSENLYTAIKRRKFNKYNKLYFNRQINTDGSMVAGGYYPDLSSNISGQPEIRGYKDIKPPVLSAEVINNMDGGGFYLDLNAENVGGMTPIGVYDDRNPPLFVQGGGDGLNQKIQHLINFISAGGGYRLPKNVVDDIDKIQRLN